VDNKKEICKIKIVIPTVMIKTKILVRVLIVNIMWAQELEIKTENENKHVLKYIFSTYISIK